MGHLLHTLDIDEKRDVAPSPTPGFPLGWMLLSNVSSASSEGQSEDERMKAGGAGLGAGGQQ